MVVIKGKITKIEEANIEVTHAELKNAVIANFNTKEVLELAFQRWKKDRGLASDSILSNTNGEYFWQSYEDHGGHYSGYYVIRGKYEPGDEVIWNLFKHLLNTHI